MGSKCHKKLLTQMPQKNTSQKSKIQEFTKSPWPEIPPGSTFDSAHTTTVPHHNEDMLPAQTAQCPWHTTPPQHLEIPPSEMIRKLKYNTQSKLSADSDAKLHKYCPLPWHIILFFCCNLHLLLQNTSQYAAWEYGLTSSTPVWRRPRTIWTKKNFSWEAT